MARWIMASAVLLCNATALHAQGYETGFGHTPDYFTADWHLEGLWALDATPASVPGGPVYKGTASLNYNNQNGNYHTGSANKGTATSPVINVRHLGAPLLTFRCNYQTESSGAKWDKRIVQVWKAQGPLLQSYPLSSKASDAGSCAAMGTWHTHAIPILPKWERVQIKFVFDSVDYLKNGYAGWFVDDFRLTSSTVSGAETIRYSTHFDSSTGWQLSGLWAMDSTPATVNTPLPGLVTYYGAASAGTKSLNYNGGSTYDTGGKNFGEARSPVIEVSGWGAVATFWCLYVTETYKTGKDSRLFWIRRASDNTVVKQFTLAGEGNSIGIDSCSTMGVWHQHTVPIDPSLGTVRVSFYFNSIDGQANKFPGWFVDKLEVSVVEPDDAPALKTSSYVTTFEDTESWTMTGLWAIDGSPSMPGGASYSGTKSLNYNNGANYSTGGANLGVAKSSLIDVSHLQVPIFSFRCAFDTDTLGIGTDQRKVRLRNQWDGLLASYTLAAQGGTPGTQPCDPNGWHEHTIPLDPKWTQIRVEFRFDTVTGSNNGHKGWFIDDVLFDVSDLLPTRDKMRDTIYLSQSVGQKKLRFATYAGNAGYGPLTAAKDNFEFEEADGHNHLHFTEFADHRLVDMQGNVLQGKKQGFCLMNMLQIRKGAPSLSKYASFDSCSLIMPGWADIYHAGLSGQSIDVTGVPDGLYYLIIEFDPNGKLVESNENNNDARFLIEITGMNVTVVPEANP